MLRRILPNRTIDNGVDAKKDWVLWRWHYIEGRTPGVEYLTRLNVLRTPWFGIKIHWFHAPDPDPHCHDHPWWFLSLVLKGVYQEKRQQFIPVGRSYMKTEETDSQRRFLSVAFRRSTDVHRITMASRGCVTLILNGPKVKSWCFWRVSETRYIPLGAWGDLPAYEPVPWREYLAQ